jgi:glucose-6-phosphate-specific signal transduction histidine kinase
MALDLHRHSRDRSLLQCFCLIVQSFQKIPALHALAPTQTEPPFKFTQLIVLALFFVLAIAAAIRFRIERIRTTSI